MGDMQLPEKESPADENDPLTCIRDAYTLSNTSKATDGMEELMVKNFLATLAEVALGVASRMDKE